MKISLHGVQIERPSMNKCPMLKTIFQMMYHKNISRKKIRRSMMNMMVNMNAGCSNTTQCQRTYPHILEPSYQPSRELTLGTRA
jgi:hypothetical protein